MKLLPKYKLPENLFTEVVDEFPGLILLENPASINFKVKKKLIKGKSIKIMRNETLLALARRELCELTRSSSNSENFIKTILGQRNLLPLSSSIFPQNLGYAQTLELFKLPDFVVYCDSYLEKGIWQNSGVSFCGVDSFGRGEGYLLLDVEENKIINIYF